MLQIYTAINYCYVSATFPHTSALFFYTVKIQEKFLNSGSAIDKDTSFWAVSHLVNYRKPNR